MFSSRFALTVCHVTGLLHNDVFVEKERKKNENDEFSVFAVEQFELWQ